MPAENKVEKWKIDPELAKMAKRYKAITKISDQLKKRVAVAQSKLQVLTQILYGTERVRTNVLNKMDPKESVVDRPENTEADLRIRY